MDRMNAEMCKAKVAALTLMSGTAMTVCMIAVYLLTGHRVI